jgi:hypothetical protein
VIDGVTSPRRIRSYQSERLPQLPRRWCRSKSAISWPVMVDPFSSTRFRGSRGIPQEANPTTKRRRPDHATEVDVPAAATRRGQGQFDRDGKKAYGAYLGSLAETRSNSVLAVATSPV